MTTVDRRTADAPAPTGAPRPLRGLLRLDPSITDFRVRGFPAAPGGPHPALTRAAGTFVAGFNYAVGATGPTTLHRSLSGVDPDVRGFAYEGAAMALGILDLLRPGRPARLCHLLEGPGAGYPHLVHVGAGWAFARLWRAVRPGRLTPIPVLGWLGWDGWGFYQGFFRPEETYRRHLVRRAARRPERRRLHDQGAGRALMFYANGRPAVIAEVIGRFPAERRPDLWAGAGLAAGYTGALSTHELDDLAEAGGAYAADLAQGAAFGGAARLRAGHLPSGSSVAVRALTGRDATEAAAWTDDALAGPLAAARRGDDTAANYERWRAGVRTAWARHDEGTRS